MKALVILSIGTGPIIGISISGGLFLLIGVPIIIYRTTKKRRLKKWKVGDRMYLDYENRQELEEGWRYGKLVRWNMKGALIALGQDKMFWLKHEEIEYNMSLMWRKRYWKAKKLMGKDEWQKSKLYRTGKIRQLNDKVKSTLGFEPDHSNYEID